jgi:hypothetical protein
MKLPFPVYLNHFFITVDSATYKAIESDNFLRGQFAASEQRTTVRTDRTYTGLYFYGTNTYFEFFDDSKASGYKLGDSGIAFGVDDAGAIESLGKEMASEFFAQPRPITRLFDNKQVPWFSMAVPKNLPISSGLSLWVMEYHPRFLAEWNPASTSDKEGVSRRQILGRYKAALGTRPPRSLLDDVVAITIALDKSTSTKLADLCEMLGYHRGAQGSAIVLEGPDLRLRLIDQTDSARGIQEITLRVKGKPAGKSEFRFGKSVLRFRDDGLAIWTF